MHICVVIYVYLHLTLSTSQKIHKKLQITLLKITSLFFKYFLNGSRYEKNSNIFKFLRLCKKMCTVKKMLTNDFLIQYLENEKRYRQNFNGFLIHEKRSLCGKILAKIGELSFFARLKGLKNLLIKYKQS